MNTKKSTLVLGANRIGDALVPLREAVKGDGLISNDALNEFASAVADNRPSRYTVAEFGLPDDVREYVDNDLPAGKGMLRYWIHEGERFIEDLKEEGGF